MHSLFTWRAKEDLDTQLCDIIVAWDELEKSIGGYPPLDSNYIGHKTKLHFANRAEVVDAFTSLQAKAKKSGDTAKVVRISQFLTYIDCAENPDNHPFQDYFTKLTGMEISYFWASQVATAKLALTTHLNTLGIPFEGAHDALYDAEIPMEPKEAEAHIRRRITEELLDFKAATNLDVELNYDIKIIDVAEPWRGWMSGDADGKFLMQFNQRNIRALSPSFLMYVSRHELLGHATMETLLRERVLAGKMPRSCGITTMADDGIVQAEALAETAGLLTLQHANPLEKAWRLYVDYMRLVENNSFSILAEQGIDAARRYYDANGACSNATERERLLGGLTSKNPQPRMYIPNYPPVRVAMTNAFKRHGHERFGQLVGKLYRTFGGHIPGVNDAEGLNKAILSIEQPVFVPTPATPHSI